MTTMATTPDQVELRRQVVVQAINSASDQMRSDAVPPHNYMEQLSWLFFLKAFDETETRLEQEAAFEGSDYQRLLDGPYRWSSWASRTSRPDEMVAFVDKELWPHLRGLHDGPIAERISRIFSTVKNHQTRGASFARVVTQVDRLHFSEKTDVDVLSEIYERLLRDVASVAGYAGEFYTPRHIIAAMVQVVKPRLGDKIYDPCFGSGGFLWMGATEIRRNVGPMGIEQLEQFHKRTIYGRELGPLAYLNGTMGLLLHDVHQANLELVNTLEVHTNSVAEHDKYGVILANPPYGGKLPQQVQTNFTIRSGATEILFVQHIMASLAKRGRAAVIVPEGVLFRGGPDRLVRKRLIEEFNLHTILSLPAGCFLPYTGVKTDVLFFNREEDGRTTDSIWYYDLTNDGFELRQTRRSIPGSQIPDFIAKQVGRVESDLSWTISVADLKNYDSVGSKSEPRGEFKHKPAIEVVQSMKLKQERINELLDEIEELLGRR